jgi:hypothetical protein
MKHTSTDFTPESARTRTKRYGERYSTHLSFVKYKLQQNYKSRKSRRLKVDRKVHTRTLKTISYQRVALTITECSQEGSPREWPQVHQIVSDSLLLLGSQKRALFPSLPKKEIGREIATDGSFAQEGHLGHSLHLSESILQTHSPQSFQKVRDYLKILLKGGFQLKYCNDQLHENMHDQGSHTQFFQKH